MRALIKSVPRKSMRGRDCDFKCKGKLLVCIIFAKAGSPVPVRMARR